MIDVNRNKDWLPHLGVFHVVLCVLMLTDVSGLCPGLYTLYEEKADLPAGQVKFWPLSKKLHVPFLQNFSLCVDLWHRTNTSRWIAFTYQNPDAKNNRQNEIGLAGKGGQLIIWLFGETLEVAKDLGLNIWHRVCIRWSNQDGQLWVFVNGTVVLNKTLNKANLAPEGSLTLGVNHRIMNGNTEDMTNRNFVGYLYYFQMWNKEWTSVSGTECYEGSIIRWNREHGLINGSSERKQPSPRCEGSSPISAQTTSTSLEEFVTSSGGFSYTSVQNISTTLEEFVTSSGNNIYKIEMTAKVTNSDGTAISTSDSENLIRTWLKIIAVCYIELCNISVTNRPLTLSSQANSREGTATKRMKILHRESLIQYRYNCIVFVQVTSQHVESTLQDQKNALENCMYSSGSLSVIAEQGSIKIHNFSSISNESAGCSTIEPVTTPMPPEQTTEQTTGYPHGTFTPVSMTSNSLVTSQGLSTGQQISSISIISSTSPSLTFTTRESADGYETTIPTMSTIPTTDPDLQASYYELRMDVKIRHVQENVTSPSECIQSWLEPVLKDKIIFLILNITATSTNISRYHRIWERETRMLEKRRSKSKEDIIRGNYFCVVLLQVKTTDSEETTRQYIKELLQSASNNSHSDVSITCIQIIIVGNCLYDVTNSVYWGSYIWPKTPAESTANQSCAKNTTMNAFRRCKISNKTFRAHWQDPELGQCPMIKELPKTIPGLEDIDVNGNNAWVLAELIKNLTTNMTSITEEDLNIVLLKVTEVVEVGALTPPLGQVIIDIISNVLKASDNLWDTASRILKITDAVGNKMFFTGHSVNLTSDLLALSTLNINFSSFMGITFGVSSLSHSFGPEIFISQIPIDDAVAFISLPSTLNNHLNWQILEAASRLQFQFFANVSLFQDPEMANSQLSTYVVSASVTNATVDNLRDPVIISLKHLSPNLQGNPVKCVFWDMKKNRGLGGWSSEGCVFYNTSLMYTTCHCNHLTHFGVLLDLSRSPIDERDDRILTMITYIGCGLSSIFLGVTLVTYIAFGKLRRDYPSKILMNLSTALLLLNLAFLVNSWFSSFGSYGLCIAIAVFMHYFLLASFTWMGLEAVHMYFALVKVFNVYIPSYILKFCIFGWGAPLVVVSIVLAIDKDAYGRIIYAKSVKSSNDHFCWVQNNATFYVSVVAYFMLVLVCNLGVFIVVLVQIRNMKSKKPAGTRSGFLYDLKSIVSLTFLLGLTWSFACFAWGPAKVPFLYLFSIFNSLQGFFIFLFHCLMKENVRKQWRIHLCCGRFRLEDYSDWSRSATNGKSKVNNIARSPSVKSVKSDKSNSTSSTSNGSESSRKFTLPNEQHNDLLYEYSVALSSAHHRFVSASGFRVSPICVHSQESWGNTLSH